MAPSWVRKPDSQLSCDDCSGRPIACLLLALLSELVL